MDSTNDYDSDLMLGGADVMPSQTIDTEIIADVQPEPVETTQGYDIKDGVEVIAAKDMASAVNYDLIILIILLVAMVGGAIFFFLKQRQGHQQVPTSEPRDDQEEQLSEVKIVDEEKVVETQEQM